MSFRTLYLLEDIYANIHSLVYPLVYMCLISRQDIKISMVGYFLMPNMTFSQYVISNYSFLSHKTAKTYQNLEYNFWDICDIFVTTLREEIFAGGEFREFHEFWPNSRKLIPFLTLENVNSRKLIPAKFFKIADSRKLIPTKFFKN